MWENGNVKIDFNLGHGVCDQETRQCLCEAFWMQNLIQKYFGNGDSNCGMLNYSFYYII